MSEPRDSWVRRPAAVLVVAPCVLGAMLAVTGLVVDAVVLQAAGVATVMSMLPPALVALARRPDDGDDDEGEGPGGGGRGGPDDPRDLPPAPDLDWGEFDSARRAWERAKPALPA